MELDSQLPADWNDFDWIVSSAMLEYIPQDKIPQALRSLRRLLNENGSLLVLATKRTWISRWLGGRWWGTHTFDQDELAAKFQRAGFKAVQFRPLPSFWRSSIIAVEAKR